MTNSLNLNVSGLPKSATLAINERYKELLGKGRNVYNFGLGQSPFPVPEPMRQSLMDNAHQKDYLPVEGLPELREAIAQYHSRVNDSSYTADQVLVGPGSKELMFLVQLVYYGDLVIPTPSWVSYAPQARIIGRHVHWLPTRGRDRWMLSAETLDAHCREDPDRPRLAILNYPSNPTGATLRPEELEELADVARKYEVVLLSDEIYGELHHEGEHVSIARHYRRGTIISGGISKWCGAGGWRLGYFLFPQLQGKLLRTLAVAASETFTSTSAPIQYAAISAFGGDPRIDAYLRKCRHILKMLGRYTVEVLDAAGARIPRPEGAFYLFPDFSRHRESLESQGIESGRALCEHLLERTGVAALPGEAFGCAAPDLSARMAYVDFDGARALEGYDEFTFRDRNDEDDFVEAFCPRVVEGVRRVAEEVGTWV